MGSRTREELERDIDKEPYDAEVYAVFGDLPQCEGDLHGELLALQLTAERDPARERAPASYFKRHADTSWATSRRSRATETVTAFFERAHAAIANFRAVVEAHRETSSEGEPHTKPSSERIKL